MTRVAGGLAFLALMVAQGNAHAQAQSYFWPDHHEAVTFKMKSYSFRGTFKLVSGRQVQIGEHLWRELTPEVYRLVAPHEVEYWRGDESGLFARYSTSPDEQELVMLKLPAKAGDSWQSQEGQGASGMRTVEKVGDCVVRGKTFEKCITVGFEAEGMPAIAVFAPGYGEVVNSQVNGFVHREITTQ